jgi:hypothetical protein
VRLPTYQDLSREQHEVYFMRLDGTHLVTGPPGTGKTVMALWRAQALNVDDRPVNILMHSNVLKGYTSLAAAEVGVDGGVETYRRWFKNQWNKAYGADPPMVPGEKWSYDWSEVVLKVVTDPPRFDGLTDVLVDEGQDLHPSFYRVLQLLAKNATVFADENQRIGDDNSLLEDIALGLGRATERHLLTVNYRNTAEIAALAAHFYCGAPTGIPDLPERRGELPLLRRHRDLDDLADLVVRHEQTFSDRSIGVILPRTYLQAALFKVLDKRRTRRPVQAYLPSGGDRRHWSMDFAEPGIRIINHWQAKGLEFDTVFLPELQLEDRDPSSADVKMRYYVACSRAREELWLSWSGDGPEPAVVADIPNDVLERL